MSKKFVITIILYRKAEKAISLVSCIHALNKGINISSNCSTNWKKSLDVHQLIVNVFVTMATELTPKVSSLNSH